MINFNGTIICASKYFDIKEIKKINELGITDFGENQVQSLLKKKSELNNLNLIWHFIGNLQTNKIKQVINEIDYLHSLQSIKQAEIIQKYRETPLKCFIQLNISEEVSKSGISTLKLDDFINSLKKYDKIVIVGFMTIGVNDDLQLTNEIFSIASNLKDKYELPYLSIGMTNDYELAIKNNATHLRIGSLFKSYLGGYDGVI